MRPEQLEKLRVGDRVLLSGTIFSARDAAHKRLIASIRGNEPLPIDLQGQVIYYLGPTPAKSGEPIGAAGPTTSYRMDPYAPELIEKGLKGMIGKGSRSQAVKTALKAFAYAVNLACLYNARITILHALADVPDVAVGYIGKEAWAEIKQRHMDDARSALIGKSQQHNVVKAVLQQFSDQAAEALEDRQPVVDDIIVVDKDKAERVLSTILCEIVFCHFLNKGQVAGDFSYGFRPPVEFHL